MTILCALNLGRTKEETAALRKPARSHTCHIECYELRPLSRAALALSEFKPLRRDMKFPEALKIVSFTPSKLTPEATNVTENAAVIAFLCHRPKRGPRSGFYLRQIPVNTSRQKKHLADVPARRKDAQMRSFLLTTLNLDSSDKIPSRRD